jgi:formate dehydrogenase subunit gamma
MNKAIGTLALCLGLLAATASAQPQDDPVGPGGRGIQSANILDESSVDQAARQQVQPLNNAPIWRAVNSGQAFYTQLPRNEGGVLIDPEGEPWRLMRNGPMTQGGGWWLAGVLGLIALFFLLRGPIRMHGRPTGRVIERFTLLERTIHWLNGACFVWLALTGLLLLFGKHVVLPWLGPTLFSWLAIFSKTSHNFVGPLFAVTTVLIFITFVRDNIPRSHDLTWLKHGGGFLSKKGEVPSHRFNAGSKLIFWGGVVVLGLVVTVTGFILDFPNFGQSRSLLQDAWWIHVGAAFLYIAVIMGHIYLGTIGMEGALKSMTTGYVDETWAQEHHRYWYDDIKAGKIPAVRSKPPSEVASPGAPVASSSARS